MTKRTWTVPFAAPASIIVTSMLAHRLDNSGLEVVEVEYEVAGLSTSQNFSPALKINLGVARGTSDAILVAVSLAVASQPFSPFFLPAFPNHVGVER